MILIREEDETYLYCPIFLFFPLPHDHKGIQLTTYLERENFLFQHTKLLPEKTMEDCDCYGECIPDKDQSEQDAGEMSFQRGLLVFKVTDG